MIHYTYNKLPINLAKIFPIKFLLKSVLVITLISLTSTLCLTSCASRNKTPPLTLAQIRERQTHTFENTDAKSLTKVVVDALQDEGYTIKSVNNEIGLITAENVIDLERRNGFIFVLDDCRFDKLEVLEMTINISEFGSCTKLRMTCQMKMFDNYGIIVGVRPVTNEAFYQKFFAKVSKGLFYQSANL